MLYHVSSMYNAIMFYRYLAYFSIDYRHFSQYVWKNVISVILLFSLFICKRDVINDTVNMINEQSFELQTKDKTILQFSPLYGVFVVNISYLYYL